MKPDTGYNIDIAHSCIIPSIEVMQGDGGFQSISVVLTKNGRPWFPPAGAEAAVAYAHSNGTTGLYNKLSDGTAAVSIRGNLVTAILAPQMLAVAGEIAASIVFNDEKMNQLTTSPVTIIVKENPFADVPEAEAYIRLQWLEDKLEEYLKKAKDSGMFDGAKGEPFEYDDFTPEQLAALTGPKGDAYILQESDLQQIADRTEQLFSDKLRRLEDDVRNKQDQALARTVSILVADWKGGTSCTKEVGGVTADRIVICDASDASVQCTAQGAGSLTFSAGGTPNAEVTVKVVIL